MLDSCRILFAGPLDSGSSAVAFAKAKVDGRIVVCGIYSLDGMRLI